MPSLHRAFIIRPFGTKREIDFDRVEAELISPALDRLQIGGRTTLDVLRSGNIRIDMFQALLVADVVIADVSIHNANVFYELGIRHALRRAATVMIRGREGGDRIPFDLFTDRYLAYDDRNPAASVDELVRVLEATIAATETDSPVFQLLPDLVEQEAESFLAVPRGFSAAVERAQADGVAGDLALLAAEIGSVSWQRPALRAVGRAQKALGAMEAARDTWEELRRFDDMDLEANELLGTIYHRLGDLAASDIAIDRVLRPSGLPRHQRAEAWALKGRNAKTRWIEEWNDEPDDDRRTERALASGWLAQSYEHYAAGFRIDLMNYYPGINALAMLVILSELAERHPRTWLNAFADDEDAERELAKLRRRRVELISTVQASIDANQELARAAGKQDLWADVSDADLALYRGDAPARVSGRYDRVRGISPFQVEAVRAQLEMFARLRIHAEAALAGLATLPQSKSRPEPPHVLLFTGHRVDDPGRETPRFPPDRVEVARQEIGAAIDRAVAEHGPRLVGISGAASGGDILFHQECRARGIPTTVYLALPEEEYAARSVSSAGAEWTRMYHDLLDEAPSRTLQQTADLPVWLAHRADYGVWQRSNLWMLHNALAHGIRRVTLIALWNGTAGDGPGGTADMVDQIRRRGGEVIHLGMGTVFPG